MMTGITLVFFWVYLPVLSKYHDLKIQEDKTKRELDSMNEKIKTLQEERDLLRNDMNYLEKVIRDELGLVRPGEMVYKFVPEKEGAPGTPAPSPSPTPSPRVYDPKGMNYRS
jgi:cell division protein FtsB